MSKYKSIIEKYGPELLNKKDVVSVGFGYKTVGGRETRLPSVVCGVVKKRQYSQIATEDLVPAKVGDITTDVVEVGEFWTYDMERPARGGASIGHFDITAGTLGCVVDKHGEKLILSNNHVLANSNDAVIGDPILQPGPHDGGTSDNVIAILHQFIPIDFRGSSGRFADIICQFVPQWIKDFLCSFFGVCCVKPGENLIDAALGKPVSDDFVSDEIISIGYPTGTAEAELGMRVQKTGRTTGYTTGTVVQVDAMVDVNYGKGRVARFVDQVITTDMSEGGDSGSVILNMDEEIVGLLFAGSPTATIMNRIQNVFEELDITL